MLLTKKVIFLLLCLLTELSLAQAIDVNKLNNILPKTPAESDENRGVANLQPEFYPIGFSRSGLFAYILVLADEAGGDCYPWEFVVADLSRQRTLENLEMKREEDCGRILDVRSLLKYKRHEFEGLLNKHKIDATLAVDLKHFPLTLKDLKYEMFVRPVEHKEINQGIVLSGERSMPFLLWLVEESKSMNRIVGMLEERVYIEGDGHENTPFVWNLEIVGFLQSPFERRIVVLVSEIHRGWEGPPNVVVLRLFAVSLSE